MKATVSIIQETPVSVAVQPYIVTSYPIYDGSYTVSPSSEAQTLSTSGKRMIQDMNILAIKTSEVHNTYGITFTIGG